MNSSLIVRQLGNQAYESTWRAMKAFTDQRQPETVDELWCCQHPSVYTQGLAGKPEHVLKTNDIPIIQTDRGGQVTYHGPGQLMLYTLFDIKRLNIGPRRLVCQLENSVIDYLASLNIDACGNPKAPGVYVGDSKIASIGLRIRRGCSYHGLALNVELDTTPFQAINPCGFKGLAITQLAAYTRVSMDDVSHTMIKTIAQHFGYQHVTVVTDMIKA